MLSHLSITNIVLIEKAELDFTSGLCVLSGETGAGKSILLDALGLVTGARGDSSLVRAGEAQGTVTAEFDISKNNAAKVILEELELEVAEQLLIRRVVSSEGKSRILVNDTPVSWAGLKKLGETLVEVHGQHDQRSLQDTGMHRDMLDGYGALQLLCGKVASAYATWKQQKEALAKLLLEIEHAAREKDYLEHMQKELHQLDPKADEEEQLADERAAMMGNEKRCETLNEVIGGLNSKEVLAALRNAQKTLMRSAQAEQYTAIIEGLEKAAIETEEALYALEKLGAESNFDPEKLEQIDERFFALKGAARKYNVPVSELRQLREEIDHKLSMLSTQTGESAKLEKQVAETRAVFVEAAEKLSEARKKAALRLEKTISKELAPLKMEGTCFRVLIDHLPESSWSQAGSDLVAFECATNVGKDDKNIVYAPLSKIASGGELSRFMLAMKVALMGVRSTPTIIFDEIDSGTGGAVADAIGKRLAQLGEAVQVLVVTHLPQVAARGSAHIKVLKKPSGGKIKTTVEMLAAAEREEELARMLAGETITAEARKAAAKLLEQAA